MKNLKSLLKISDDENGSALPYIFGWLLGVPFSILLLIALLRSVF